MKDIGKILLYLAGIVIVGALLAPLMFWFCQHMIPTLEAHGWIKFVQQGDERVARGTFSFLDSGFQRYFNRAVLVAAFALLWPLVRALRFRNFGEDLGLRRNRQRWRQFFSGFTLALLTLVVLGAALVAGDLYYMKDSIPWGRLAWLPFTAISVALIEEALFRGAIQGIVQRTTTSGFAVVCVAALFASVHFLKPQENTIAPADVHWWSGLALVPQAFWQFEDPQLLLGGFTTLLLVGLILGFARARTRSLWMPVGLHAGWIIGKMSFSKMTKRTAEAWPWFGSDMLVGLGPVIILLCAWAIVWWWLRDENAP